MHPAPAPRRLPDLPPVLLLVALIAFIPGGLFPFVWAKILLLGGALLLHAFAPVRHAVLPRTDVLLLLAGLAWLTVAAFAASSALPSLLGRWPRYEGIPVILSYAGCVVMGAHVLGGSPASNLNSARRTFLDAAAATAVVIGLVALIEVAGLRPLGGSPDVRPGSTLGNASDLGLAAVMLVAMLLPAAQASRSRLHVVGAAVAAITVGVSGSRAALVGLLAVLAVLAIGVLGVRRRAARSLSAPVPPAPWQWPLGVAALAAVVTLAIPTVRDRLASTGTITGRFALWDASLDVVAARPLTGSGPSGFVDAVPIHITRPIAVELGSTTVHDSPHVWILQAASAGGIVLAMIAIALAARVLWAGRSTLHSQSPFLLGALAAVVGYGTASLTHFTSPGTTPLAAMLAGAVLARPIAAPLPTAATRPVMLIRAVAGGATGVLVLAALAASMSELSLKRATDDLAAGDVASAEDAFREAAALRPWDADVALLAAQAYATAASNGVDGSTQATVWATRALETNPLSVEAGLALAVGQLNSGELVEALETLNALDDRAPHNALLHVHRAITRFGLADPAGAIADLEEAAALDPDSSLAWTVLARIHERLGDTDAAARAATMAAERS